MTVAEKTPTSQSPEKAAEREEWVRAVDKLMEEVKTWSHLQGWRTVGYEKQILDDSTQQEYEALVLDIITEPDYSGLCREVKLIVEPAFFDAARKSSRVDFSVWPTMYQVVLLYKTNQHDWTMSGDVRHHWPSSWGREAFIEIAGKLLEMGR